MNLKKRLSAVLSVIFLFNMIGFQTSFAENASETDTMPQEQAETQIMDDVQEFEQVENTAQPQPTLDAAQDNEVEEDQEVPSPSAEAVEDTQPDVEAQNPIFQEGATDVWEIEESPVFQDVGESGVITLSDNEYLITGISSRSLEVYVTNGYNPIPNAQVTICGQTIACDESGYAVFSNIPTAEAPYDLIVNCEYGQKTESILLPNTEVVESADAEVPARKATISYWTPEMETSAAVNSVMGVSVMSDISDEENWSYSSSGVSNPTFVGEYNDKIYVYGNAFKVYNPANGT